MGQNEVIKNNISDQCIKRNKGTVSDDNINIYCDKHNHIFNEIDNNYCCMKALKITDKLILKTKFIYIKQYNCGEN